MILINSYITNRKFPLRKMPSQNRNSKGKLLFFMDNWIKSILCLVVLLGISQYLVFHASLVAAAFFNVLIIALLVNSPLTYLWLKYRILSKHGSKTIGKLLKKKLNIAAGSPGGARNYRTYTYSFEAENTQYIAKETDYFVHDSDIGWLKPDEIEIVYCKQLPTLSTVFNPSVWLRRKKLSVIMVSLIINTCWLIWVILPLVM